MVSELQLLVIQVPGRALAAAEMLADNSHLHTVADYEPVVAVE